MPCAYFTCIFLIISKILISKYTVFITYELILFHVFRVELDLQFHIFGYGEKRTAKLVYQYFFSFGKIIDISVITIAFISYGFGHIIAIITHTKT